MMSIKEKIFQVLDETLFRVFDIASQRNQYFKRYLGSKLANFYTNY